jgi:hypothetical protein
MLSRTISDSRDNWSAAYLADHEAIAHVTVSSQETFGPVSSGSCSFRGPQAKSSEPAPRRRPARADVRSSWRGAASDLSPSPADRMTATSLRAANRHLVRRTAVDMAITRCGVEPRRGGGADLRTRADAYRGGGTFRRTPGPRLPTRADVGPERSRARVPGPAPERSSSATGVCADLGRRRPTRIGPRGACYVDIGIPGVSPTDRPRPCPVGRRHRWPAPSLAIIRTGRYYSRHGDHSDHGGQGPDR